MLSDTVRAARAARGLPASAATRRMALRCAITFLLGIALISLAGLAPSETLHAAAHDSRHGLAFPCH